MSEEDMREQQSATAAPAVPDDSGNAEELLKTENTVESQESSGIEAGAESSPQVEAPVPEEKKAEEPVVQEEIISEAAVEVRQEVPVETAPVEAAPVEEPKEKKEPKWYIVQTLTGLEDRVKAKIERDVDALNWRERILRVLVPEEETVELKGTKRIVRKRKMYPGYVFVEMVLDDDVWFKIRDTAGVARFIGGKSIPAPVTDKEMQRVLKQLGIKEKEIVVEFQEGDAIRIISGSFRGYTGSVSEINAPKSKLKAMINIFGRDTSVEVDFDRVEKLV